MVNICESCCHASHDWCNKRPEITSPQSECPEYHMDKACVACTAGCVVSCCHSKGIYIFHKKQIYALKKFALEHGLMGEVLYQYNMMRLCDTMAQVNKLGLCCPFIDKDTKRCRLYFHEARPKACEAWLSPDVTMCQSGLFDFPESIAQDNHKRMTPEPDCCVELRFALCDDQDNFTYGPFIDSVRAKLKR